MEPVSGRVRADRELGLACRRQQQFGHGDRRFDQAAASSEHGERSVADR